MHWGGVIGIGGVAAVAAVAMTRDEVRHYPLPVSIARDRLASAPLPQVLSGIGGGDVSLVRQEGSLLWQMGAPDGRSEARVFLTGKGASTDVTIQFTLSDRALGGSRLAGTGLTRSLARSILVEHVDAVLSGRSFDQRRMALGAAAELQANPLLLQEFGKAVRQNMIDLPKVLNAPPADPGYPIPPEDAYSNPGDYSGRAVQPDPASFKPMTSLDSKE